jgi:hypothetical protein
MSTMSPHEYLSTSLSLTMSEIVTVLPTSTFSYSEKHCWQSLENTVSSLPLDFQQVLAKFASSKPARKAIASEQAPMSLAKTSSFAKCIHTLTMKEMKKALPPDTFTPSQRHSRLLLENAIVHLLADY